MYFAIFVKIFVFSIIYRIHSCKVRLIKKKKDDLVTII